MKIVGIGKMLKKHLFYLNRENDVAAIDINMGCPKEFSVQVRKLSLNSLKNSLGLILFYFH
jgi:hypothetical protein